MKNDITIQEFFHSVPPAFKADFITTCRNVHKASDTDKYDIGTLQDILSHIMKQEDSNNIRQGF